jgi:MFS family permease
MAPNFPLLFGVSLLLCVAVTFRSSDYYKNLYQKKKGSSGDEVTEEVQKAHNDLLKRYLFVYLLATLSDWLQGPYVYALYMEYGFQQHEIAQLFVAGFASSMIFGSFVGSMADWGGRKSFVIIYAIVYAASCLTKHFKHYGMLMLGRLLGGVSTSLLFSVFDAWLIRSHADANLPKSCLAKSFSWAAFGNSSIAILAGLIANNFSKLYPMQQVAEYTYIGGFLNPFDLAFLSLVTCAVGAWMVWDENYGEMEPSDQISGKDEDDGKNVNVKWYDGLRNALTTTLQNRDIMLCGIISSLFEGSMYIFVFMWTPLLKAFLTDPSEELPFGLIFSTFMVCCMTGSSLFSIVVDKFPVEKLAIAVFGLGSCSMALVALGVNETVSFIGMNLFEVCVGMYWPIMGTMKGGIVPEDKRAAIYNLYRIPLNFIVLFSLLTDLAPIVSFFLTSAMLALAAGLQLVLSKRRLEKTGTQAILVSPNIEVMPLIEDDQLAGKEPPRGDVV